MCSLPDQANKRICEAGRDVAFLQTTSVVSFDIYYREVSDRAVHYRVSTVDTTKRKEVSKKNEVGAKKEVSKKRKSVVKHGMQVF